MMANPSYIQYIGGNDSDNCGYCKSKNSCFKAGLWAFRLRADDYQEMIDRGWRRCGNYCYKPDLAKSCCAMYTIRCDTQQFRLSRSQKKILKKCCSFLKTGEKSKSVSYPITPGSLKVDVPLDKLPAEDVATMDPKWIPPPLHKPPADDRQSESKSSSKASVIPLLSTVSSEIVSGTPNLRKAKQRRIERKREKLASKGFSEEEILKKMREKKRFPVIKTIEHFLKELDTQDSKHKLEVRLVRSNPPSPEFQRTFKESFCLYKQYQIAVHKDKPSQLSEKSFSRFLVESPLEEDSIYGSFHHQYWLDGKLIAVGVLDILPACVSSVYFFYDPDYAFLGLGTYGALREIELVRSLCLNHHENLKHYYMGFYIHSCPKMRYKGAFKPSFLLCPEVYSWHPLSQCTSKLDKLKYSRLNENPNEEDQHDGTNLVNEANVFKKRLMKFGDFTGREAYREDVTEFCKLVGSKCIPTFILQLP